MDRKSIVIAVVLVVIVGVGAYLFGQQRSNQQAQNLQSIVDLAFPPPPQELYTLSGLVKGVYGATINIETDDVDDYLPHPDGSPPRKEVRFANVTAETTYTLVDFIRLDQSGNPTRTPLQLADVKEGDIVIVKSNSNIRSAQKFDVTAVEVVRY